MDNKIKYVDLNGLKTFAETLKQDLKNRVIELGLYQELLHRIENLELYKIVDSLPEIGDENTIYLLKNPSGSGDKNVFIEYLYNNEHGWEEIGNFTPSFDLEDYLKIENASFEKGISENSAVLKGGNNIAGLKGWYYKALYIKESIKTIDIYLTKEQTIPIIGKPYTLETDVPCSLKVGDIISLVNDIKYDNAFEVISVGNDKVIRVVPVAETLPFTSIIIEDTLDPEDYSIYCLNKPFNGIVDIGQGSFAAGYNNKATNGKSTAFGFNNHSYGKFSFTAGKSNEAGFSSCVVGKENKGLADQTFVTGLENLTTGNNSHIEGNKNINRGGVSSHIEGRGNIISDDENDEPTSTVTTPGKLNYSHVEGLNNQLRHGHATHIEGKDNEVYADYSHVENNSNKVGTKTKVVTGVHVEGNRNTVKANGAHVENADNVVEETATHAHVGGRYNIVNNPREFACGVYNKSTKSSNKSETTHFSIGIGNSNTDRKNAFEVKKNGDIYIEGVNGKIQDKLNVTPDWNAKEGESGYIKNRTHHAILQSSVENRDSSGYDIIVYATIDITGQETPVIIFEQPFINDNTISDSYGNGDLSNILRVVKGNSILKRFDKSASGDNDPYFARVTIEDTVIGTYDETTILHVTIRINTLEDGYGIDAAEVVGSIYGGTIVPLNETFIPDTVLKTTPQTLSNTKKNQVRDNIYAQEKLVSGVNITTINNKSILKGGNINLGKTTYDIDLNSIGKIEGTTVTYTCQYGDLFGYYTDSDKNVEFKKLCEGEYDIVYSHGIGGTSDEVVHIIPTLKLVYSGTSIPNYYSNEIMSYYSCKDWLLTCHAVTENLSSLFNSETIITITLEKLI